jgi:hypothetical protein
LFNSRLERLKTGGGSNESIALDDIEEKVKDMMQLSVESMPSQFDCDSEIDAMPLTYNYAIKVDGNMILIMSCICLQQQIIYAIILIFQTIFID